MQKKNVVQKMHIEMLALLEKKVFSIFAQNRIKTTPSISQPLTLTCHNFGNAQK